MITIDLPTDAPVSDSRRDRLLAWGALVGGIAVLLVALLVISPSSTAWRSFVAIIGLAGVWLGIQNLGRMRFGRNFSLGVWLSGIWLVVLLFSAIFAGVLPIENYKKAVLQDRLARPGLEWPQPLGRDANGGSLLSRVVFGARTSLTIVVLAITIGLLVGCLLGLIAGYFGRLADAVINIFATATLAFPALILLITISAVFKRTVWSMALGLAILSIPTYTRLMRAQTIALLQREFVLSARAMGASRWRVIFREILPNAFLPVASYTFISASVIVIAEGSIAYLGLGIPAPKPSWGSMIAEAQIKLKTDPHLVFVPAVVMFLTVLSFNRIGDWARKRVLGETKI
jgi:peptide/nickel transport system permease protein